MSRAERTMVMDTLLPSMPTPAPPEVTIDTPDATLIHYAHVLGYGSPILNPSQENGVSPSL